MKPKKKRQCMTCGAIHWLDRKAFRRIKSYYRTVCRECERDEKRWYRQMQKLGLVKTPAEQNDRMPVEELIEKYSKAFEKLRVYGVDPCLVNAARADRILAQMGMQFSSCL